MIEKVLTEHNPLAPHQSVINLSIVADIMERLEDGKVSGRPKKKIKRSKLFTIKAQSYDECVTLTEEFLSKYIKESKENGESTKETS